MCNLGFFCHNASWFFCFKQLNFKKTIGLNKTPLIFFPSLECDMKHSKHKFSSCKGQHQFTLQSNNRPKIQSTPTPWPHCQLPCIISKLTTLDSFCVCIDAMWWVFVGLWPKRKAQRIRQQMRCLPQTWPTHLDYTTSHHTSPFYHWSFQIGRLTD
jgi:hypothetical protein